MCFVLCFCSTVKSFIVNDTVVGLERIFSLFSNSSMNFRFSRLLFIKVQHFLLFVLCNLYRPVFTELYFTLALDS